MLATYLWKEWRVFRPTLIALAVMALLVCPLILLLPGAWTPGDFVGKVTVCALLAISITIGAELLPYERTGQRMQFLGRLPGGERMAFLAKLIFLLASLLTFACFCYLVAQGCSLFIRPGFASPIDRTHVVIVLVGIIVSLWAFAISSWIKHATLVLPILALLLVFGLRPILESPLLKVWQFIGIWNLGLYFALMTAGALMLAWFSYTKSLGKSPRNCLRTGAIAGLCFVAPWAIGTLQFRQWFTPNPSSADFQIMGGLSGVGHRYAFLDTTLHKHMYRGIIVDLQNGEWRAVGKTNTGFFLNPGALDGHDFMSGLVGEHDFIAYYDQDEVLTCYDGKTTKPFDLGTMEQLKARQQVRLRKSKQRTTPIRLPDGRKAWVMNRILETLNQEGAVVPLPWSLFPEGRAGRLKGLGIRFFNGRQSSILDLVRERSYEIKEGRPIPTLVLPEGWLVTRDDQPVLYDPDSELSTPVSALAPEDKAVERMADGRILTYRDGHVYLTDLQTYEQEEVSTHEVPTGFQVSELSTYVRAFTPTYTPTGDQMFRLAYKNESGDSLAGLSTLNLKTRSFGPLIEGRFIPMSFPADDIMLAVVDQKRIERINLVTGERKILFPRK